MKESYNKSIQLICVTCGDSNFEANSDKSWIKCNRCEREYNRGYEELVELNQGKIDSELEETKKEIKADIEKDLNSILKNAFKNKSNFKLR